MTTYSDSRMVLAGILDHPDTLKLVPKLFFKILVWLMLRHATAEDMMRWKGLNITMNADMAQSASSQFPSDWFQHLLPTSNFLKSTSAYHDSHQPTPPQQRNITSPRPMTTPIARARALTNTSTAQAPFQLKPRTPGMIVDSSEMLPSSPYEAQMPMVFADDLLESSVTSSTESVHIDAVKSVRFEGVEIRIEEHQSKGYQLMSRGMEVNSLWVSTSKEQRLSFTDPKSDEEKFRAVAALCFCAVVGNFDVVPSAERIWTSYSGQLPSTFAKSWLLDPRRSKLRDMAMLGYRYAVKFVIDNVSLGEWGVGGKNEIGFTDLEKLLEDHQRNWFMTVDPSSHSTNIDTLAINGGYDPYEEILRWERALNGELPNVFALGKSIPSASSNNNGIRARAGSPAARGGGSALPRATSPMARGGGSGLARARTPAMGSSGLIIESRGVRNAMSAGARGSGGLSPNHYVRINDGAVAHGALISKLLRLSPCRVWIGELNPQVVKVSCPLIGLEIHLRT
ncbi:Pecanex-like protein 4 [Quaeritorhiza haematococci]|nr:Pecanex-like protein 4 [Quaeritorhiza haematococci]